MIRRRQGSDNIMSSSYAAKRGILKDSIVTNSSNINMYNANINGGYSNLNSAGLDAYASFRPGGEFGVYNDTYYPDNARNFDYEQRRILHNDAMIFAETSLYHDMANLKGESVTSHREEELEEIKKEALKATSNQRVYQIGKQRIRIEGGKTGGIGGKGKSTVSKLHRGTTSNFSVHVKKAAAQKAGEKEMPESSIYTTYTTATHVGTGAGGSSRMQTKSYAEYPGITGGGEERETSSYISQKKNLTYQLASMGYSADQLADTADVLQFPSTFSKIDYSLFDWLSFQRRRDYWYDRVSLFVLALTVAVGIGSMEDMWFLMDRWHGMIFIVPWIIVYIVMCQPILAFELCIGQIIRGGTPKIYGQMWRRARGLGIAMVVVGCLTECIAHSRYPADFFLYVIYSFRQPQPWKLTQEEHEFCQNIKGDSTTCVSHRFCIFSVKESLCLGSDLGKANLFFRESFFSSSPVYTLDSNLVISITIAWLLIASFQMFGLSSFSFVAAATLILIAIVAITHVIVCFGLNGSSDAAELVLYSWNWNYLWKYSSMWTQCCTNALYELSLGVGVYVALGSHSRIGCNVIWETYEVLACQFVSSGVLFMASVGIVGYVAVKAGVSYGDLLPLASSCPFVVFPVGFYVSNQMEVTVSVLFFGCSAVLFLTSISVTMEIMLASLQDTRLFCNTKRWKLVLPVSFVFYLCALSLASKNGRLVLWFIETYVGDLARMLFVLAICVLLGWCCGFRQQVENLGLATTVIFGSVCWLGILIVSLLVVLTEERMSYCWWLLLLLMFILTAAALAVYCGPSLNGKAPKWLAKRSEYFTHKPDILPIKTRLWWLFIGNIEEMRGEISRIVTGRQGWLSTLTIMWSISIKWIDNILISICLVEMIDGYFIADEEKKADLELVPTSWKVISIAILVVVVLIVVYLFLFPDHIIRPLRVPAVQQCQTKLLPSRPPKVLCKFRLTPIFAEFFPTKMSRSIRENIELRNRFLNYIASDGTFIDDSCIPGGGVETAATMQRNAYAQPSSALQLSFTMRQTFVGHIPPHKNTRDSFVLKPFRNSGGFGRGSINLSSKGSRELT